MRLLFICFGIVHGLFLVGGLSTLADTPPNVVYIIADDVGFGDLGCYGASHVKTPNLDRLANEGCRFTDAHSTASVCTPTRFALMTGRYAWRQPNTGIARGDQSLLIPPGTPTIASVLKQAGYATGVVGKWHLGLGNPPKTNYNLPIQPGPLELGFDYCFLIPATGDRVPCVYVENHEVVGYDPKDPIEVSFGKKIGEGPFGNDPNAVLKIQGGRGHKDSIINGIPRIGFMTGGTQAHWVDEDMADLLAKKAIQFLESHQRSPFFLLLSTHDIHEPMVPNPRFRGSSQIGWRGDVLHQLDDTVGQVLQAIDRLQLTNNTLVIFTSDNGGAIKDTYDDGTNALHSKQPPNAEWRDSKGSLYEGGHRVPYLARWPQHIAAGSQSDALIAHVDTLSTFCSLTHQPLPPRTDSFNALPALLNHEAQLPVRDHLILQGNFASPLALREGDWILIERKSPPKSPQKNPSEPPDTRSAPPISHELYNLRQDPKQKQDQSQQEPDRVRQMVERLQHWRELGYTHSPP